MLKKRICCFSISLLMILTMLPLTGAAATAEEGSDPSQAILSETGDADMLLPEEAVGDITADQGSLAPSGAVVLSEDDNVRLAEGEGIRISYQDDTDEFWAENAQKGVYVYIDGLDETLEYGIEINAGVRGDDSWDVFLDPETDYTKEAVDGGYKLTFSYKKLMEAFAAENVDSDYLNLFAAVYDRADYGWAVDEPLVMEFGGLRLREARYEYDFPDERDILPDWGDAVNHWMNMYAENAAFPEGADFGCEVTDVAIISNEPDEAGKQVLDFHIDYDNGDTESDNYWWYFEGRNYGTAKVKISYKNPAELVEQCGLPETAEHVFTVHVGRDVYNIDLETESGSYRALPGSSITLIANGRHETDYEVEEGQEEPLSYEWVLEDWVQEYAEIKVDPEDDSRAVVTFRELSEEELQDGFWRDFRFFVKMTGADNTERAEGDLWITLADSYYDLYPARIDGDLVPGTELPVTVEVRHYPSSDPEKEYDVIDHVLFGWSYDDQAVEVRDADGNLVNEEAGTGSSLNYKITRLHTNDTELGLCARWEDDEGNLQKEERRYRLNYLDYNFWFREHDTRVFNDETKDLQLDLSELEGLAYDLEITAGTWAGDDWDILLTKGQDYTVSGDKVTVYGNKIYDKTNGEEIRIEAVLKLNGQEMNRTDCWCEIRQAMEDFHMDDNEEMFIGWEHGIDRQWNVWVENAAYPDGQDFVYEITDLSAGNPDILEVIPWDDGNGWNYRALAYGDTTITFTYQDYKEETGEKTIDVHVVKDMYGVRIYPQDATSNSVLAGGTITYLAVPWHKNENGDTSTEGLTCRWSKRDIAPDSSKLIGLTPDPEDPFRVSVRGNGPVPDNYMEQWADVVAMILKDGEVVAEDVLSTRVADRVENPWPAELDFGLDVGKSQAVDVELRQYSDPADLNNYLRISDIHVRWYYDDNAVKITDKDGQVVGNDDGDGQYVDSAGSSGEFSCPFTITRLKDWDTDIHLSIDWTDENGDEQETRYVYTFESKEYTVHFASDYSDVYNDQTVALPLFADLGKADWTLDFEAGVWDEEDQIKYAVDNNAGIVKIEPAETGDYYLVKVDGVKLNSFVQGKETGGIEIRVYAKIGDEVFCEARCWFESCEACGNHFWTNWAVVEEPTCTQDGLRMKKCANCGEEIHEIIPRAHSLVLVPAKAATLSETGNTAYYKCENCGKYFSDESGKNEIAEESTVIAKLIDIDTAAVSGVVKKTYNGKAQTQTPKLTVDGKTLGLNTDYDISYTNNKNAGTAVMTITGKGLYSGTKKVNFVISKAANPMTAKTKVNKVLKVKTLKKKKQTVKASVYTVKNAQGTVTYKKSGGNNKIKINKKTGVITVPKGMKKGKYSFKVLITAAGNGNYNSLTKTVKMTITVK